MNRKSEWNNPFAFPVIKGMQNLADRGAYLILVSINRGLILN